MYNYNNLFGKYYYLKQELEKNITIDFEKTTFNEIFEYSVATNMLSILKNINSDNITARTNLLNIRNIIEYIAVYEYDKNIGITNEELMLMKMKYIYTQKKLKDKYKSSVKKDEMNDLYYKYYEKYSGLIKSSKTLKYKKFGYLQNSKFTINQIIENNKEEYLKDYELLSIHIHPSTYSQKVEKIKIKEIINKILFFIEPIFIYEYDEELKYDFLENIIYNEIPQNKENLKINYNQISTCNKISTYFNVIPNNSKLCQRFLKELQLVILDINTDYHFNLVENIKMKSKIIFEMIAFFYEVYLSKQYSLFLYNKKIDKEQLEFMHLKEKFDFIIHNNKEIKDKDVIKAYNIFKNKYPDSKITKEELPRKMKQNLGHFIDGLGETFKYTELCKKYFSSVKSFHVLNDFNLSTEDFLLLLYKESQNTSHASGYLLLISKYETFSSLEVVNALDTILQDLIYSLFFIYMFYQKKYKLNSLDKISKEFRQISKELVQKYSNIANSTNETNN